MRHIRMSLATGLAASLLVPDLTAAITITIDDREGAGAPITVQITDPTNWQAPQDGFERPQQTVWSQ